MVNLNLISKDKFQKMGFKNKATGIAFIKTVLQTKVNRFNTIEQLAQHVKPKINNMKDLGIDINSKQNSIIHKGLKQLKQLKAKWHVRVSKQSCKQANRLILWGVGAPQKKNSRFF